MTKVQGWGARVLACALGLAAVACAPVPSVEVARGAITVAGPAGYCVDPGLSRAGAAEPVVVLSDCAALSPLQAAPRAPVPAILTATVAPEASPAPDLRALERYLRSQPGRAAMARSGRADAVAVVASETRSGALYLFLRESGTDAGYWRVVTGLGGHLVTLTVRGAGAAPLARAQGHALAQAFVAALRAANPAMTPATAP